MAKRKLSTEERHAKQKAKLQAEGVIEKQVRVYTPEVSLKEKALAVSLKAGYRASLLSHVLYFQVDTYDEIEKVREFLVKNYGDPIPFSFGVRVGKGKVNSFANDYKLDELTEED